MNKEEVGIESNKDIHFPDKKIKRGDSFEKVNSDMYVVRYRYYIDHWSYYE
jgi:hypothetical protein